MTTSDPDSRYVVISSDCHAGADVMDYREYLPTRWHEEFDRWANRYADPWTDVDGGNGTKVGLSSGAANVNWDSACRLEELEADGVAAEVIFPNTSPPFFPSGNLMAPAPTTREEYERRWVGLQAHNRWLRDFCGLAPGRRAGVAQIFVNDVDDAVAEIKRLDASAPCGGILLPGVSPGGGVEPLYSERYEPLWRACAERGLPINHHTGATGWPLGAGAGSAAAAVAAMEGRWWAQRTLMHLIFAGVFERHRDLTFVMTEQGTGWLSERLRAADSLVNEARTEGAPSRALAGPAADKLSRLPSEYVAQHCYVGASLLVREEVESRHRIGVDRIMWGSDYPHSEGTFPYSVEALRLLFWDAPVDEVRAIVGGTAAKVYGFDISALDEVAARIGPSPADIATPLDSAPRFPEDTVAHTFIPGKVPN